MVRVPVKPDMLRWACDRAGHTVDSLTGRFPKLEGWLRGELQPTLKQLERFAKATHAPFGYFFLPNPPIETVPIPDFRTIGSDFIHRPSPNLLDTIYACQRRQDWYAEYVRTSGESAAEFVASVRRSDAPEVVAEQIRSELRFSIEERRRLPTWTDALRRFIGQAEGVGVLVMVSGVVGNNNNRKLDPAEFRGFALCDAHAPLVFINGADTKAAQMFTLAHELAHLWLGESALSDLTPVTAPSHEVERWCNKVAAELLVPMEDLRREFRPADVLREEVRRLARYFKVSTLVILRRIHDAGGLTRQAFWAEYEAELATLRTIRRTSGGSFFHTTAARVGKRFARGVVSSTLEGRSSFTEAMHLLGFKKMSTFFDLGRSLGVDV